MGVLARFERRLGGAVEGSFARVFKSRVEPVELAVALKRECDDKKSIGPVQTLVPNDFVVDLGPSDHERLAPYILTLGDELGDMVREHGEEQGYTFLGPVEVAFHRDEALSTGAYRIGSRVEAGDDRPPPAVAPPWPPATPPATVVPAGPDVQRTQAIDRPVAPRPAVGQLELPDGNRVPVPAGGLTIGRGQECDVRLADASVSRRHASLSVVDGAVVLEDLGSTNGTTVNGDRVDRRPLRDRDRLTFGAATVTFRG